MTLPQLEDMLSKASGPNPGSDAAIAAGCTCPISDNHRGAWGNGPQLVLKRKKGRRWPVRNQRRREGGRVC